MSDMYLFNVFDIISGNFNPIDYEIYTVRFGGNVIVIELVCTCLHHDCKIINKGYASY